MRLRAIEADAAVAPSSVRLTWLGQAGWLLLGDAMTIVIDPYLSDSLAEKYLGKLYPHVRMAPAPISPTDLGDVDVVLCTHHHTDHMDPQTLTALVEVSDCLFVVPAALVDRMVGFGVPGDRIVPAREGEHLQIGELGVDPVLAAHESVQRDERGRSIFLGYVLTIGELTIYHSGDCVPYAGQVEALRPLGVDVALLPVNGRDASRTANGVPGNFHPKEATALAESIGARLLVAHHFGMFDFNTVDQAALDSAVAHLNPRVGFVQPTIGSSYVVKEDE